MRTSKTAALRARAPDGKLPGPRATHSDDDCAADSRAHRHGESPDATIHALSILADEAARERLARDVHDSVGAELAAAHFALANARAALPADAPPQCADALALAARSLTAATEAFRNIVDGLGAPQLDAGLVGALADWTRSFGARTGLATSFVCAVDARLARLSGESALAVFRVAQEALANVARHARARRADVRLDCSARHLTLTIADDGIGLPRSARANDAQNPQNRRPHRGLAGMRARCRAFGGTLRAGARGPAKTGTTVRARFGWPALLADGGASSARGTPQ
jgi:signal transduction histidine kinase